MKKSLIIALLFCFPLLQAQEQTVVPLTQRVSPQDEFAAPSSIIDGEWVAVGTRAEHAIAKDYSLPFDGKPSYRFELKSDDNTLEGYAKGETKGRAELAYCYAVAEDVKHLSAEQIADMITAKKVYHYGKGSCEQGSTRYYRFSVYIPSSLPSNVNTIFAQWHGMPDRTLLQTPDGTIKKVTDAEFSKIAAHVIFKKDTGYDKIPVTNKDGSPKLDARGNPVFKADTKPNGWLVEQGGYPPLAFGFSNNYFYIKANSDRKWLTDKTDRCNIEPSEAKILVPRKSVYKASTIAYKMPFADFPKDKWVTFTLKVEWTTYGGEKESIVKPGILDVKMDYKDNGREIAENIVKNAQVLIGRNDDMGYYFKFGIYRVGNSTVPVSYHLAGYREGATKNDIQ